MSDINDPPWVVEIDGLKFATPEAVVILLKAVSEERDELEAELDSIRASDKDAWAWIDDTCKWLGCGTEGVFAIQSKIEALEAGANDA